MRLWIVLSCAVLAACSRPLPPLPQDAYVWQTEWTASVSEALAASAGPIRAWRVLAATMDGEAGWRAARVDAAALAATGKPVVMVVRIDGQLVRWDQDRLRRDVLALAARWRAAGIAVTAIEIDHDCGTARLAAYAGFLKALRAALPDGVGLSLTALPAWLDAPALRDVLAQVDEAVLQVHAVTDPRGGLFDANRALGWMRAFGEVTAKPWRVALPTYGSKVVWDGEGRIVAVDSERPSLVSGSNARELRARPEEAAAFLAGLDGDRPKHLAGVVWFRLPTGDDTRSWSLATWLAVVNRQPLRPHITAAVQPADQPGLYDLALVSDGTTDAALPARITIEGSCGAADGINFYHVERAAEGLALRRTRDGLLPPGRRRGVGWARCDGGAPILHLD